MNTNHEILSAFIDGEEVDAAQLSAALDAPGTAAFLIDCAQLRSRSRRPMGPLPEISWKEDPLHQRSRRAAAWPLAAAALLVALALSWAPQWTADPEDPSGPPEPERTIVFQPGLDWH